MKNGMLLMPNANIKKDKSTWILRKKHASDLEHKNKIWKHENKKA